MNINTEAKPNIKIVTIVCFKLSIVRELVDFIMVVVDSGCGTSTDSWLPSVIVSKSMQKCNLSRLRPLFAAHKISRLHSNPHSGRKGELAQ